MKHTVSHALLLAGLTAAGAASAHAQAGVSVVDTQMSVYLAGGNTYTVAPAGGGGLAPAAILLDPGTGRVLTVAATGTGTFCPGGACGTPGPDGPSIGGTNLAASGAISGIVAPSSGFLAAVFLGPALPAAAPGSLDFSALTLNFTTLSPTLGQVFFVGDGVTSGAVQQQFLVPDGATRLFFGIADGGAFIGNPGFYGDNVGTYTATFAVTSSTVPEPATIALVGGGLLALGLVGRRRRTA